MKSRAEAEVMARKSAQAIRDRNRKIAKKNGGFNSLHKPFSETDYVKGFLECWDLINKKEGENALQNKSN